MYKHYIKTFTILYFFFVLPIFTTFLKQTFTTYKTIKINNDRTNDHLDI